MLLPSLLAAAGPGQGGTPPGIILATLGGLGAILAYDSVRWCFPRRWFRVLWPYDHIYKLISSFIALLSAAAGNTITIWAPWPQLLPSVIGTGLILFFCVRHARRGTAPE